MGKVRIVIQSWKHYWGELKYKRNEEGLTLIELMVVVVILGIISAVAIPAISSAINSAKVSTTESDLATLQQALQRYYIDNNQYPTTLSSLTAASVGGPYMDVTFPEKDAWSNPIYYAQVSGTGYYLISGGSTSDTKSAPSGIKINDIYAAGGTGVTPQTPTAATGTVVSSITFVDN